MTTKRAYKLQEFVAHASSVNCLKIGRKSSRVLLTGGEDHKVNLWAIGKPNSILSLSGHTSAVESVNFDSSEVLVAAGAASGTIKLWDLEEAKLVRTLTGHRSNCISVDFHPFGEFFASGSLDTNLKIWDIRRKGCIHTYKSHTRGVNAIRFTPDGRWVVSGGEDHVVKLWDLTAGKLLHDFKCHEGQIQCIDFHPHEFLLATGSTDRTMKFWDLETFELIGSSGTETSFLRSMTFNPDGRTLLCGLHESLKVFSWEPVRCHDAVEVGWSKLSDLNIHEGKLLGCSYNQSCVGVWVVDISRLEPYATANASRLSNGHNELNFTSGAVPSTQMENNAKVATAKSTVSQIQDLTLKDARMISSSGSATPQKVVLNPVPKTTLDSMAAFSGNISAAAMKRSNMATRNQSANFQIPAKNNNVVPVVAPRASTRGEQSPVIDLKRESTVSSRSVLYALGPMMADIRKTSSFCKDEVDGLHDYLPSASMGGCGSGDPSQFSDQKCLQFAEDSCLHQKPMLERNLVDIRCTGSGKLRMNMEEDSPAYYSDENCDTKAQKINKGTFLQVPRGRMGSEGIDIERSEKNQTPDGSGRCSNYNDVTCSNSMRSSFHSLCANGAYKQKRCSPTCLNEVASSREEDTVADLCEQHDEFLAAMQSRLSKLQAVRRFWVRSDYKGAIGAMEKMSDHAVAADVIVIWLEKCDTVTLDTCCTLLPLLTNLLESDMDRHSGVSLEMLLKLVKLFGPVIRSTLSVSSSVGVDLQAEQRLERCNSCAVELEKVKQYLPALMRRGGFVAKFAQELSLTLTEVVL